MEKAMPEKTAETPPSPVPEVPVTKDVFELQPKPVEGDALDPLNWSSVQKHVILAIVMAL